ncbi:MAG: NAD(P)-dependent oxidoreductase [Actinomycetota bacterium]|nr:NAD(P)-dependent oxidoreductase [Actinomycetota bacterium]
MSNGRVLVTGAAGRLGSAVLAELARRSRAVTALDRRGPAEPAGARVVIGEVADVAAVREALEGVEGVIHLAAIPSPLLASAEEVFCHNSAATFTVLEQAAVAGVRRCVLASSYSATGLPYSPRRLHPAYVPIDESLPLQVEDPYALSKQVDELTAAMMWYRHGLSSVALRLPFLGHLEDEIARRAEAAAADPGPLGTELWMYLDVDDAARACLDALDRAPEGAHVAGVAAPETLASEATLELLERYHPGVRVRAPLPGRAAPIDLSRARALFDFRAERIWRPVP